VSAESINHRVHGGARRILGLNRSFPTGRDCLARRFCGVSVNISMKIVVQAVIELMLQVPGELRMVEIAGVNRKHVGMNRDGRVLEVDQNLDLSVIFAGGKREQGMLVEAKVIENFFERGGVWHGIIVLSLVLSSRFSILSEDRPLRTEY